MPDEITPKDNTDSRGRIVVCSVPKAGTYLLGDLLVRLGYRDTKLHLGNPVSQDYRNAEPETALSQPNTFDSSILWPRILEEIKPGDFALSHISSSEVNALSLHRVIFLYRNLRDVLCAYARFVAKTGRWGSRNQAWTSLPDGPEKLRRFIDLHSKQALQTIKPVSGWYRLGKPTKLCYEGLMGDHGEELQNIQFERLLEATGSDVGILEVKSHLQQTLNRQTMTKSEKRTEWQKMWSKEAELFFEECGLKEINASLGYENRGLIDLRKSYSLATKTERRCPVCDRNDYAVACKTDRHDIGIKTAVCKHCGAVYTVDCPSMDWIADFYRDQYWSLYDIGGIEYEAEQSLRRTSQMLNGILTIHNTISSILDIGCGTGGMLRSARQYLPDARIYGIDPSHDAIARCRGYGFDVEYVEDISHVKLKASGTFDLITIIHVAEHLYDPIKLIASATKVMSDEGLIYIDVPDIMSRKWNGADFIHIAHLQSFHRESLRRLLDRCGLEPVAWKYGLAKEWPWAIGVLARKSSLIGMMRAESVSPLPRHKINRIIKHIQRHTNPPLPNTLVRRMKSVATNSRLFSQIIKQSHKSRG